MKETSAPDIQNAARTAGEKRGVDIEDDQPFTAPGEPRPLHRDVDTRLARHLDQAGTQRAVRVRGGVGAIVIGQSG